MRATRLADNALAIGGGYAEEHLTVVATGDGLIVVDTLATLPATRAALPLIRAFSTEPVRVVINTHLDADHVAGNHAFAGAAIVAHTNGAAHLDERLYDDPASEQMVREVVEQQRSSAIPSDPVLAARRQTALRSNCRPSRGTSCTISCIQNTSDWRGAKSRRRPRPGSHRLFTTERCGSSRGASRWSERHAREGVRLASSSASGS